MFLKAVVWELEDLLGEIGPELAVHAGMYMLTILVGGGAPCVIPLAAPVGLFVDTGDLEVGSG